MKKNSNKFIRYFILSLLMFSMIIIPFRTNADSGWDSGYSGGGSSSHSSSSHSSSRSSRSSGSSSHSNTPKTPLYYYLTFVLYMAYQYFIFRVIMFLKTNSEKRYEVNHEFIGSYDDISNLDEVLLSIGIKDKAYFKENLYNVFKDIQIAWMEFDYDKLREYTTDELFNMYKSQLEALKLKNQKNIMSGFNMLDLKIINVQNTLNTVSIDIYLNVEFFDYVIDINTNKVVRGNSGRKININYIITYVSRVDKHDLKCPNCGAELMDNSGQVCPYCHSTIVDLTNKFVMSKKKNIGQK